MDVYVIRHGEAQDDIDDCYGGIADFPLTDNGRQTARATADQLRDAMVQLLFTSPLARARETAEIIAAELGGLELMVVEDLQERNSYGVLSGVNKALAAQIFTRVLSALKEKPGYSREPLEGAEDFDAFVERVRRAFTHVVDVALERRFDCIGIVTHGKFSQALFEHVVRISEPVELKLSAINAFEYAPATARLFSSSRSAFE